MNTYTPIRASHQILVVFILAGLTSCASHQSSFKGDRADVRLAQGKVVSGELLCLSDSGLYIVSSSDSQAEAVRSGMVPNGAYEGDHYSCISLSKIKQIGIHGYVNHNWWALAVTDVIGAALVAGEAAKSSLTFGLIFLAVPILDLVLFIVSEPNEPELSPPFDAEKRAELRKYLRIPLDLDSTHVQSLLKDLGSPKKRNVD